MGSEAFPSRFRPDAALRRRHGPALDALGPLLLAADPPADALVSAFAELPRGSGFAMLEQALRLGVNAVTAAPAELRTLFAQVDPTPAWVDRARQRRGGQAVLRAGIAAGVVLGMKSLILGYASPGGNKPLVFSGRLRQQAPRRLAETSRFVQAVSQPGGLARFAPGFAITLKVRVMHAQVRRLIQSSGRWRPEQWGLPINQHDMLATVLLFSVAMIEGLQTLGYDVSRDEAEDITHLWRHVGLVMGVRPELLPLSYRDGVVQAQMIRGTQGPPDDDARALAQAMFEARVAALTKAGVGAPAAARHKAAMQAVCRKLIGDQLADALALPRSLFDPLTPLVRPVAGLVSRLNRLPWLRQLASTVGDRYWDAAVAEGLGDDTAHYTPPDHLATSA